MIDVENNGQSRLCCFKDGYDMCDKCADFLDNVSLNRSKHKESKKLRVIVDKIVAKENGTIRSTTAGPHHSPHGHNPIHRNEKKSTASSTGGGGAWVMDGVQLKTISKAVQQMQTGGRHDVDGMNSNAAPNGVAIAVQR